MAVFATLRGGVSKRIRSKKIKEPLWGVPGPARRPRKRTSLIPGAEAVFQCRKRPSRRRLADELRPALSDRGTVCAETRNALDEILKLTRSNSGAQPISRGGLSHQEHKAKIVTKADYRQGGATPIAQCQRRGQNPRSALRRAIGCSAAYVLSRSPRLAFSISGSRERVETAIGETAWATHLVADHIRPRVGSAIIYARVSRKARSWGRHQLRPRGPRYRIDCRAGARELEDRLKRVIGKQREQRKLRSHSLVSRRNLLLIGLNRGAAGSAPFVLPIEPR